MGKSRMFASLSHRNYRVYFTGALISNIGTWIQRVAQDWLVLELSHGSAVAVGITTALQFLPALLLSPAGGLLADRMDKRVLLAVTQTWMAVSSLVLGVLAVAGLAQTWHVYLIALVFGIGAAIDVPARQSFVTEVAGRDNLTNAIGLNSASFNAARLIGPGVGGLIIAAFGSGWAILTNAVSYGAMLAALLLLNSADLERANPVARAKGQVREGFRYVAARPELVIALGVGFAVGTFALNFQLTNAVMVSAEFGLGAKSYGFAGSVMGIGSLAGALLAARRLAAPPLRYVVGAALVFAALLGVLGLMPSYPAYLVLLPVVGLAGLLTMTATNMFVQTCSAPSLRGRVMALYAMVMMGGTPVGAPLMGWLAEVFGPRAPLWGGAVLQVATIGAVVLVVRLRSARRLRDQVATGSDEVPSQVALPPEQRGPGGVVQGPDRA
ncbi:putative major facilitator superfamily transporter [Gordonia araii NBRC 100433]|uniref:Putative major facilitator superfamily transporter n=1 Tax=Gordonia araii NBRC 100433 TaxID=1073574 RepID=G7H0L5_9ACTN|nr:putative major facilitator superfamily transporter [Gordonia araii NBRC 100433]